MKIAIIFFGLPRNTQRTLPSIQKYILDELSDVDYEIYSCLTLQSAVNNPRSGENGTLSIDNYDFFSQFDHAFLPPEKLLDHQLFDQILSYGNTWKDQGESIKNLMMQLRCLNIAFESISSQRFDYYFFIRPDLIIHDSIPIRDFFKLATKNSILIPSWQWYKGLNDRFAIASSKSAKVYADRYKYISEYCKQTNRAINSEQLLKYMVEKASIDLRTCSCRMSRCRSNDSIEKETFSVLKHMGSIKNAIYAQKCQLQKKSKLIGLLKILIYLLLNPSKLIKQSIY